jgi:hypothetical protein
MAEKKQNNFYKVQVKRLDDADKFRPAAKAYEENGYYTPAPKGTREYKKFWSEELRRSRDGYTSPDGEFISGYNYFYLNFCQIIVTKEIRYKDTKGYNRIKKDRVKSFPWFYDYDRAYFDAIEEAETHGKHLVVLKKRGSGYSFKCASMLCRNFYCFPDSLSIAAASEMEFLTKNGILSKAWEMMDFIDAETAFGKKRQKTDTKMHKRASIVKDIDGIKTEIGYRSEIMGITMKNDPQKMRGKRAKLILYEEGGHFPNLITTWQIARPSVEDDDGFAYGLMIAFGTGSTDDQDFIGLKDLFYNPEAYNALEIENQWSEYDVDRACGFFVPQYYNMYGKDADGREFMDKNGNSNIEVARKFILQEREKIVMSSSDRTAIDRYIIERPLTPEEACLTISTNIFPKKKLLDHLNEIRNNDALRSFKQVGRLEWTKEGTLKWEPDPRIKDLTRYQLKPGEPKEGAIVIWEHPTDNPPWGLYIAGIDPYDHDKSTTDSLGSIFIFKRFQDFESFYDLPVAEYTGRPETANEFYENCRRLIKYYNATALYENEKKGLFTYFEQKHAEHMLADQPGTIKDIIKDTKVQRGKGIHMNKEIKMWGEGKLKDYLIEEFAPGQQNLLKIYSEPLLEELINYNDDGNFDRVIAMMLVMIYREELYEIQVKKKKDENYQKTLIPQPLFTHNF